MTFSDVPTIGQLLIDGILKPGDEFFSGTIWLTVVEYRADIDADVVATFAELQPGATIVLCPSTPVYEYVRIRSQREHNVCG